MDRNTKITLNIYNTRHLVRRLQTVYDLILNSVKYTVAVAFIRILLQSPKVNHVTPKLNHVKHCPASIDSDLEAFNRNPTDGSFTILDYQLAAFTKNLNEVFLSY